MSYVDYNCSLQIGLWKSSTTRSREREKFLKVNSFLFYCLARLHLDYTFPVEYRKTPSPSFRIGMNGITFVFHGNYLQGFIFFLIWSVRLLGISDSLSDGCKLFVSFLRFYILSIFLNFHCSIIIIHVEKFYIINNK